MDIKQTARPGLRATMLSPVVQPSSTVDVKKWVMAWKIFT